MPDHLPCPSERFYQSIPTPLLQAVLNDILSTLIGERGPITEVRRRCSDYQTSFPLEELSVSFADGRQLPLIFKNLSHQALSPDARAAKPEFLDDPLREVEVYRMFAAGDSLGTAKYYGSHVQPDAERYWLFLEHVVGRELYQVGEFHVWLQVARWLAELHHIYAQPFALPARVNRHLVQHTASYYEQWCDRVLAHHATQLPQTSEQSDTVHTLQQLAVYFPQLTKELAALPTTLVHGEFYPSNIIVQNDDAAPRVCAIDWERAAHGPGVIDLAALTAGNWTNEQKLQLFSAYCERQQHLDSTAPSTAELFRHWQLARLHLALQWLGWSSDWSPPPEHRHNWLLKAIDAARQLGWEGLAIGCSR